MRYNRAELRGKMLLENCQKAKITTNEYGPHDNRKFCYGLASGRTDEPLEQCIDCGAFVNNAKPISKQITSKEKTIKLYCHDCKKEVEHTITETYNYMGELAEQESICSNCDCREIEEFTQDYPY